MSDLKTNLEQILQEKETKIIPANIKKGIQIFNVVGTLESGGSSTGDVKLFATEEEMQADDNVLLNDLAMVANNEIVSIEPNEVVYSLYFPKQIIFDTTITEEIEIKIVTSLTRTTSITPTGIEIQSPISVSYESVDGIIYNRTVFETSSSGMWGRDNWMMDYDNDIVVNDLSSRLNSKGFHYTITEGYEDIGRQLFKSKRENIENIYRAMDLDDLSKIKVLTNIRFTESDSGDINIDYDGNETVDATVLKSIYDQIPNTYTGMYTGKLVWKMNDDGTFDIYFIVDDSNNVGYVNFYINASYNSVQNNEPIYIGGDTSTGTNLNLICLHYENGEFTTKDINVTSETKGDYTAFYTTEPISLTDKFTRYFTSSLYSKSTSIQIRSINSAGDGFTNYTDVVVGIGKSLQYAIDNTSFTATNDKILDGYTAIGVGGRIEGSYIPLDTSNATATNDYIVNPKTAYVNGQKVTGNMIPTYEVRDVGLSLNEFTERTNWDDVNLSAKIAITSNTSSILINQINDDNSVTFKIQINASGLNNVSSFIGTAKLSYLTEDNYINIYVGARDSSSKVGVVGIKLNITDFTYTQYDYTFSKTSYNNKIDIISVPNKFNKVIALTYDLSYTNRWVYVNTYTFGDTVTITQIAKLGRGDTQDGSGLKIYNTTCQFSANKNLLSIYTRIGTSYVYSYIYYLGKLNDDCTSMTTITNNIGGQDIYGTIRGFLVNDQYYFKTDTNSSTGKLYSTDDGSVADNITVSDLTLNNDGFVVNYLGNYTFYYINSSNSINIYKLSDNKLFLYKTINNVTANSMVNLYNTNVFWEDSNSPRTEKHYEINNNYMSSLTFRDENLYNTYNSDITSSDILNSKIGYGIDGELTGTMPNNGTLNYTPNTTQQTIPAGYTSGGSVAGDSNLIPENIKKDVQIFDVVGTYEGEGGDDISNYINTQPSGGGTIREFIIKTPEIDMINITNLGNAFELCTNLTSVSLKNTNNAKTMTAMFRYCYALLEIINLDTSNVTSMEEMFYDCNSLVNVSLLNSNKVTTTENMFKGCTALKSVAMTNTNTLITTSYMFGNCKQLESVPLLDMSNVKDMDYMFQYCTSLTEIPNINTTNVKNMCGAFSYCSNLTTIPQLNMNKVTNLSITFDNCTNLSDDSLNNILASLLTATSYKSTKTLKYIGLSEEQATTCTTLSNYTAFIEAGWTTGY